MSKRKFIVPYVMLSMSGGDNDTVIGGGTGENTTDPFPMSFEDWQTSGFQIGYDFDEDGEFGIEEFANWWEDNGFTMEQWNELNPDHPWPL